MKKFLIIMLAMTLCFVFTACGESEESQEPQEPQKPGTAMADITFQQPDDYNLKVDNEEGFERAEYKKKTFSLDISTETDETASYYVQFDPLASNVEELYDCFVNKNKFISKKEKIEVDGQEAYLLSYDKNMKEAMFLHKDKLYRVMVLNEKGLTDDNIEDFQTLVDSIQLK